jgi:CRISPR-associated endonuclease Csn1
MIQPGQSRTDLENLGFKFKLSFYKNDIIEYEKDGKIYTERLVSRTKNQRNYIETKPIDRDKHENSKDGRKIIGLSKTKLVKKVRIDILGNKYSCSEEKFTNC